MRYNPSMTQGSANYRYALFYLDEEGTEINVDSNSLDFDISGRTGHTLEIEEILSFVDAVNVYLRQGILLLSTEEGELVYSTATDQFGGTEELSWLYQYNIQYDENEPLAGRLKKFYAEWDN